MANENIPDTAIYADMIDKIQDGDESGALVVLNQIIQDKVKKLIADKQETIIKTHTF